MTRTYRSTDVEAKNRFEYWRQLMCCLFVPADGRPAPGPIDGCGAFNARVTTRMLGPTSLSTVSAPAQFWERSANHLRHTPQDDFLLSLVLDGDGRLTQDGRVVAQRPGVMALFDTARPFSYQLAADIIVLKIPRRLLLARVPEADHFGALAIAGDSPVGGLAASLIRQTAALQLDLDASATLKIGSSVLDILAAALDAELSNRNGPQSGQPLLLDQVQKQILARLGDPTLDVATIAHAGGVSPRTLNRLFATIGTTPMRWLWQQRLEGSYCGLREGWIRRVTDAAFHFGFSDTSHFSRSFRRQFGLSPQTLLRTAAGAARWPARRA